MEVNHSRLRRLIAKAYKTKKPLCISGTTGIGKSYAVSTEGKALAKEEGRTFTEWNRISDSEKQAICDDRAKRERVFLFADMRVSQLDPSDLRGLPKLNGKDYVEWKPTLLFRTLSLDGVKGILFFDEINLAPPSVQAAAYQIVLDKAIGEISLNPNVCIIAAGNRLEDKANVFDMSAPLKNRFNHITLGIPTIKEWIDWAMDNKIDDRIIAYLQFKPSQLMADLNKIKEFKSGAFGSPRSWAVCSEVIDGETVLVETEMYTASSVGDGVAIEFAAWLKLREKIDLDRILDKPEMAKGLEIDMKWSLISAVSEKYKADKKVLDKALAICDYLEPDFGASLLRMLKRQRPHTFVEEIGNCKSWRVLREKYGKYITS